MISETFIFLTYCAGRLLSIAKNAIVVDLTLPIHGHSYQMSLLDVSITFLIFNLAIAIVSIPISKALHAAWEGVDD